MSKLLIDDDMKLPNNCYECRLAEFRLPTECPFYAIDKRDYREKRFHKCPLKLVEDNSCD